MDMESVFSVVDMISKGTLYSQLDFGSTYILSTKGNIPNRKKIFTQLQRDNTLELLRMYREHVRKECTLKHDYDDDLNRIYKEFFGKIRDEILLVWRSPNRSLPSDRHRPMICKYLISPL